MPNILGKFLCHKFKNSGSKESDKSRQESEDSLPTKSNVNEEYLNALRSNSYEEILDKVHGHLGIVTTNTVSSTTGVSTSSLSSPFYLHFSEHLLEPRQENLKAMIERLKFHRLLIEYFEASSRACNICELLLRSINQVRSDYRKIKRVIKISNRVLLVDHANFDHNNQYYQAIFGELKAISSLKNPLSIFSPLQYHDIRDGYVVLFHKLTLKGKGIKRKEKIKKIFNKVGGVGIVVAHNMLLAALLILAFHSVIGVVAAPVLVGCSSINYFRKKKKKKTDLTESGRIVGGIGEPFDVAARGIFILINDFDTTSQMIRRLQDEIEHRRTVAEICVRYSKFEVVREVVKELSEQETSFLGQLEELEEHIYLCLVTINRSRRLVIENIIANCP